MPLVKRSIGGISFHRVGDLCLKKGSAGEIAEYLHQLPPGTRPNRHAAGPFCSFELPNVSRVAGVYAFFIGEEIKYIGECADLERRFGPGGYGHIATRNCHSDGQATNCKINGLVLKANKAGESVTVWFVPTNDHKSIESQLVSELAPAWNGTRLTRSERKPKLSPSDFSRPSTGASDFERALQAELAEAERAGRGSVRIRSGDLHRQVGGYPGKSHRMPVCCKAMRSAMLPGDRIVESPPKGAGASLVIEYQLPRVAV